MVYNVKNEKQGVTTSVMIKIRNLIAIGASAAALAVGGDAFTQDDLDALLLDLERDSLAKEDAPAPDKEPAPPPPAEEPPQAAKSAQEPAESPAEAPHTEPSPEEVAVEPEESPSPVQELVKKPETAVEEIVEAKPEEPAPEPAPEPAAEEIAVAEPEEAVEEPAPGKPLASANAAKEPLDEKETIIKRLVEEMEAEDKAMPPPQTSPAQVAGVAEEKESAPAQAVEPASEKPAPAAQAPAAEVAAAQPPAQRFSGEDAEVLSSAYEMELIRRRALREQASRELYSARKAIEEGEYLDAVKFYRNASTYLGETPNAEKYKTECSQGIAYCYYLAALEEDRLGRRKRAIELMKKAKNNRHPKARRQLETWLAADDPDANKTDVATIRHRVNEKDYLTMREKNAARLKRARQFMATRELDKAMEECELVLRDDNYNEDAIALRQRIIQMQRKILKKEQSAVHDGMIAAVDKAWRPPYAINARDAKEANASLVMRRSEDDPRRKQEKEIETRMKEMRLPAISFKPPATIADAVEFFIGASRDYDRPDKPLEQRGFNIILRTPDTLRTAAQQPAAANDGFGSEEGLDAAQNAMPGLPVIPYISASDLTFYDALKYVCDSVEYKFKVHGPMIIVMQKNMSIDEMVTRSYPVLASFIERVGSASSDLKEMRNNANNGGGGFGGNALAADGGEDSPERNWMKFFETLGVNWPEGSSIIYIKSLGQLRVKNTYENLAELEKTLQELNADPRLIEIEARFVEVCQDDLNSLGFEWILNSDYALGVGSHLSRALRIRDGKFGTYNANNGWTFDTDSATTAGGSTGTGTGGSMSGGTGGTTGGAGTTGTSTVIPSATPSSAEADYANDKSNGATWYRWGRSQHGKIGLNAINGDAAYTTGQRWLSDLGNHVSGDGVSNNDKFMRLNAFLGGVDLSMILHMLAQRSDTDLLSAPKVLTRPGEEAVMKVVTEYIYPTDYDVQMQSSRSSDYNGGTQSAILAVVEPQSFVMREVGVILQATPTLTDDGNLIDLTLDARVVDEPTWKNYGMRIPYSAQGSSSSSVITGIESIFSQLTSALGSLGAQMPKSIKAAMAQAATDAATAELNNLSEPSNSNITYYEAPMEQPFFHQRSVQSSVSVYPGATIVMGGLITELRRAMDDKIPVLGDLPFIGRFFRNHSEKTSKRNLLIFVTTRRVDAHGREVPAGSANRKEKTDGEAAAAAVQPSPAAQEQKKQP